jgi:hypothetical protein
MTWKKVIVSRSSPELNSIVVDNNVAASSFSGAGANITGVIHNSGEIASDISGSFTSLSGSIAARFDGLTSDYTELSNIPNGIISSSTQVEATLNNNSVDFGSGTVTATAFVGDGSNISNITVDQSATVINSFTAQTSVAVNHNFGSKNVIATVYDGNDAMMIPASVVTTSDNVLTVTFSDPTSGRVIVGKGGHIVSGSIPYANIIDRPTFLSSSAQISYTEVQNIPSGIISSSAQIDANLFNIDGLVSSSAQLGLGTTNNVEFADLTLTGDLVVQGTTTSVQTANLLVEDKFILLNSGSANPDVGGLVIDEGSGEGHAYVFDGSRFGYVESLAQNATTATPSAFASAVVDIDAGHADISEYQKNGNIKIDSGTIFIYS